MTRRHTAFTLLEILTSIAILGILISILIPSLTAARRQAKAGVCLANLKQIGNLVVLYQQVNRDEFPPVRLLRVPPTAETEFVNDFGRRSPRWQWFVAGDDEAVIDPQPFRAYIDSVGSFGDDTRGAGMASAMGMTIKTFTCPSLGDTEFAMDIRDGAYGYNYQYLGNSRQDKDPGRWDNFSVRAHRIRKPSATVLAADSRGAGRQHGEHSFTLDPPRLAVERDAVRFGPAEDDVEPGLDSVLYLYSPVEMRHRGGGNVVFVDTHAERMTLTQLGYQLETAPENPRDKGAADPILNPLEETYSADNRMWNGEGQDPIALQHRPEPQ